METKIKSLEAREILDSRGNPTIEVLCVLESGATGVASVPSGASTGAHEAVELRDNDMGIYRGLGVSKAVSNVNTEISKLIVGKSLNQGGLDQALIELDGTPNKSRLGANAILGVSLAFARAFAQEQKVELYQYIGSLAGNNNFNLPEPAFNVINGGKHADSGLDLQEFMLIPVGFKSFTTKVEATTKVISVLKNILKSHGYSTGLGDEGGFAPQLQSNEETFEILVQAILKSGYTTDQFKIGIDAAASSFYSNQSYQIKIYGVARELNSLEMVEWYKEIVSKYPVISIEDGLSEDDWEGFTKLNSELGDKIQIVGDDLTVTNRERIKLAVDRKSINSVLIKPNQIGTLTETINAIQDTQAQNWAPFVSHRSGETLDTFIADLAVGLSCKYIKAGSLARGERICKYNRLMQIEENLG